MSSQAGATVDGASTNTAPRLTKKPLEKPAARSLRMMSQGFEESMTDLSERTIGGNVYDFMVINSAGREFSCKACFLWDRVLVTAKHMFAYCEDQNYTLRLVKDQEVIEVGKEQITMIEDVANDIVFIRINSNQVAPKKDIAHLFVEDKDIAGEGIVTGRQIGRAHV